VFVPALAPERLPVDTPLLVPLPVIPGGVVGVGVGLVLGGPVLVLRLMHWFLLRVGGVIDFEEVVDQLVVVYDVMVLVVLLGVEVLEDAVHVLGVEPEVGGHSLHPRLVHALEIVLDDVSDFEVEQSILIVGVDLDDVGNEQQRELHPLGLGVLLQFGSDVGGLVDVVIETGVGDLPLHLLEGGGEEECLELVHHHDLDDLDHDLVEGDAVHVGLLLPDLADLLHQLVGVVGELALDEAGVVLVVAVAIGRLGGALLLGPSAHHIHHIT